MKTTSDSSSSILTPIEHALERAAIFMLGHGLESYPEAYTGGKSWAIMRKGLGYVGAIGAIRNVHPPFHWFILWELTPDDTLYYGICGDGAGDRFAIARENVNEVIMFPPVPPIQ